VLRCGNNVVDIDDMLIVVIRQPSAATFALGWHKTGPGGSPAAD
jgi:hypothetical protein